ncbi:hypothetical protein CDL12_01817 [Handroanthus impetiginosus]|uniref:Uncharacterized protein n=1 Tax=Handroanthus impetiginosus TaxID=429701 RepID=A0A2G9I6S1_9LAMI|nr:hypothetical protein CDL12_01817 [Handroanthus impetiginosus]
MPNPTSLTEQISLFCSRIQDRSFDDVTVRILESILIPKDVRSLIRVRSALKQFMRDESLLIFREITQESVEIKLLCTDFLISEFAIIGDVESCLALRYEALVMREHRTATHPGLQVTCGEWLNFAEDSLENEFHSIANQACEKAIMCSKANHVATPDIDDFSHDVQAIKKIKRLKDAAILMISSRSVQGQAAAYLKGKEVEQGTQHLVTCSEAQSSGSSRFKSGIRKHNLRKLHEYRRLRQLS